MSGGGAAFPARGGFPREREEALRAPGGGDTPAPLRSVPRGKWPPSRGWGAGWTPGEDKRPARGFCNPPAPGRPQRVPRGARGARVSGAGASVRAGRAESLRGRQEVGGQEWRTPRQRRAPGQSLQPGRRRRLCSDAQREAQPLLSAYLRLLRYPLLPAPSLVWRSRRLNRCEQLLKKKKSRIRGAWPQDPSSLGAPHPSPLSPASPFSSPPPPRPRLPGARLPP